MKKTLAVLGLLAILTALVPLAAEAGGGGHHGWHRGGGRVFVGVGVGFPCCGFYPWPYAASTWVIPLLLRVPALLRPPR